jgi:hypothetical protein
MCSTFGKRLNLISKNSFRTWYVSPAQNPGWMLPATHGHLKRTVIKKTNGCQKNIAAKRWTETTRCTGLAFRTDNEVGDCTPNHFYSAGIDKTPNAAVLSMTTNTVCGFARGLFVPATPHEILTIAPSCRNNQHEFLDVHVEFNSRINTLASFEWYARMSTLASQNKSLDARVPRSQPMFPHIFALDFGRSPPGFFSWRVPHGIQDPSRKPDPVPVNVGLSDHKPGLGGHLLTHGIPNPNRSHLGKKS